MDVRGSGTLQAGDIVAIEVSDTGTGIGTCDSALSCSNIDVIMLASAICNHCDDITLLHGEGAGESFEWSRTITTQQPAEDQSLHLVFAQGYDFRGGIKPEAGVLRQALRSGLCGLFDATRNSKWVSSRIY